MNSALFVLFDRLTMSLVAAVAFATILPASGDAALFFEWFTKGAIALLFFLHGAKLSATRSLQAPYIGACIY